MKRADGSSPEWANGRRNKKTHVVKSMGCAGNDLVDVLKLWGVYWLEVELAFVFKGVGLNI